LIADRCVAPDTETSEMMTEATQAGADSSGNELTRFNALRHGVLSRYTVLPWESPEEYQTIVAGLVGEHAPHGPTEEHLVEEIAGIMWRKRRLRLAEAAAHRRRLGDTLKPYRETVKTALVHLDAPGETECVIDAIRATAADTKEDLADVAADEAMTRRALELLGSKRNDAYEAALESLREDTQGWWANVLEANPDRTKDEQAYSADVQGLRNFIEDEVLPWFENRRKELTNRPLIREHAFGEALDTDKLERLGRYEVHLDRKLERMLTMLLRLKEIRRSTEPG
jgi:ParB-like chromosome segregation protein Spo0J